MQVDLIISLLELNKSKPQEMINSCGYIFCNYDFCHIIFGEHHYIFTNFFNAQEMIVKH